MASKLLASIIIITLVVLLSWAISSVIQLAFPNSNFPSHHVLIISSLLLPITAMAKDWRVSLFAGISIGAMMAYRYIGGYHSIGDVIGAVLIAWASTFLVVCGILYVGRKLLTNPKQN
jgi:membrane-associated phospholipid phosphatase